MFNRISMHWYNTVKCIAFLRNIQINFRSRVPLQWSFHQFDKNAHDNGPTEKRLKNKWKDVNFGAQFRQTTSISINRRSLRCFMLMHFLWKKTPSQIICILPYSWVVISGCCIVVSVCALSHKLRCRLCVRMLFRWSIPGSATNVAAAAATTITKKNRPNAYGKSV